MGDQVVHHNFAQVLQPGRLVTTVKQKRIIWNVVDVTPHATGVDGTHGRQSPCCAAVTSLRAVDTTLAMRLESDGPEGAHSNHLFEF